MVFSDFCVPERCPRKLWSAFGKSASMPPPRVFSKVDERDSTTLVPAKRWVERDFLFAPSPSPLLRSDLRFDLRADFPIGLLGFIAFRFLRAFISCQILRARVLPPASYSANPRRHSLCGRSLYCLVCCLVYYLGLILIDPLFPHFVWLLCFASSG